MMMFFLQHGYRVIARPARCHGQSDQPSTIGMDHWVADLAALTDHLDLHDAIHIGRRPVAVRSLAMSLVTRGVSPRQY